MTFLVEMGVLVLVFAVRRVGDPVDSHALVVMALFAVFALGIALALSVANVYFRDVAHFVALFMQIWFYATPIIYPISWCKIAGGESWASNLPLTTLYELNPMVAFVESIRDMFYTAPA